MEIYIHLKTDAPLNSKNTLNGKQRHQNQNRILKMLYKNTPFR